MNVTNEGFNPSGSEDIAAIKKAANELAAVIEKHAPACRRRSVALTHLETASMFAVKAVVEPDG
ncbi:DUF7681 family protein [Qingshengfaniella alkalisoli]|uniref:Acb2/Tad1 hairpin domain-containing protein n=1 Tax=Qingshengfaniella alkalisoli TaxID=2599296 RepID=A0A5B8IWQ9_9RHOB|nr:hypothetical protein [Qingshengfaniella alkalisoli]QDY70124.1 hypothetical protein FPZ52_11160 [Qingshengfaniella alkalisoli]